MWVSRLGRILGWALAGVVALAVLGATVVILQHRRGVAQADDEFRSHRPPALRDLGTTKKLTVLPLLDGHAARPDLETDAGVSYLVETDDITVLFDTGNNTRDSDPAPLEKNMETLGAPIRISQGKPRTASRRGGRMTELAKLRDDDHSQYASDSEQKPRTRPRGHGADLAGGNVASRPRRLMWGRSAASEQDYD